MANIKKHLENIKGALFGKDVRSSIHDGIDAINKEVEGTTEKQNKLGEQFKNLVINEGNSNAEVAASRGSHDWLPDRLDNFDSQLEQNTNEVNTQFNNIKNDLRYYLPLTNFTESKLAWPKRSKKGRYEAWPYGNVFYDESIDKVCLLYNSKSHHTSTDGKVYFRNKSDFGEMSEPILVASSEVDGDLIYTGRRCHGACIDNEGNYVALVLHHGQGLTDDPLDGYLWIYKSYDKGKNWTKFKANVDGNQIIVGESGSCFKTKSGRLLSYARLAPSPEQGCKIIYSDDNGQTWSGYKLNTSDAKEPLEGMFVQISDGTIFCIVRGTLYTGRFDILEKTYITRSTDNGSTWSTFEELDIDMTLNNGCLIYHEDIKAIEMIYGSRLIQADGKGSLYQRIFTEKQLKNHDLGVENRIMQGTSSSDFGYIAGCKSKRGVINLFYYDGDTNDTSIYNMEGTRALKTNKDITGVTTLAWGTIDGSEKPSFFNRYVGEADTSKEGVILMQRFGGAQIDNENLPVKKEGFMEVYKLSQYNGYIKQIYTTIDNQIFNRVGNSLSEDTWSGWKKTVTTSNLYNTNLTRSPFVQFAETQKLYSIPATPISSKMSLDIKSVVNDEYFNNYVDGVRLEIIYKGTGLSGSQVLCFTPNIHATDNVCNSRIVTVSPYEQSYYIDCFVSMDTKDVKLTIKYPNDVETLIIKVVGFMFKDMIF